MIVIDKNIPSPKPRPSRSDTIKQFSKMKVGHSFGLPYVEDQDKRHANSIRSTFHSYCKRVEWEMTSRAEEGVLRVWRIA